jgi:hypothetical protein
MRTIKTYSNRAPFYNALSLTTPAYCKNFLSGGVRRRSNCVCLIASLLFICVTLTCSACLLHHSV